MHLLLDTHLLLWAAARPDRLSREATEFISNPDNTLLFSAASLWEVTIKRTLGRTDLSVDPALLRRGLVENGYEELVVRSMHAIAVGHLPMLHRDPFDRILIAQAESEGILLLTSDQRVASYPGPIQRV